MEAQINDHDTIGQAAGDEHDSDHDTFEDEPEADDAEPETAEDETARLQRELEEWKRAATPGANRVNPAHIRALLLNNFAACLMPWGSGAALGFSVEDTGVRQVRASLEALEGALKKLGKRDRGGARAYLTGARDRLARKLALFTKLGPDLTAAGGCELVERYVAIRQAADDARAAHYVASRETVRAARDRLDEAEADERSLLREIDMMRATLVFPGRTVAALSPSVIDEARVSTEYLAQNANASWPMVLHMALDGGRDATPDQAQCWIAFESSTDPKAQELFSIRFARYCAAHPDAVAA